MRVRLTSTLVESFLLLARELNFSRAAEVLHISQPALSKRIQNLESNLGQALFIRQHAALELTESGRILQRFGATLENQEQEVLSSLVGADHGGIAGFFRIVTFSSALRSVVVPALGGLLRTHPRLGCHTIKAEVSALHDMLIDGKVDYCISLSECERAGIENVRLGNEHSVLIESSKHRGRDGCYLDHEPRDNFTESFFLSQTGSTVPRMERAYFDDIYGLIDAVSAGIGRAVVAAHLLTPDMPIRVVPGFLPFEVPVFLHYHRQPYYTRMQQAVIQTLTSECPLLLRSNRFRIEMRGAVADDALVAAQRRRKPRATSTPKGKRSRSGVRNS
jgi:DNA-binding transcriptional LysR family regulator